MRFDVTTLGRTVRVEVREGAGGYEIDLEGCRALAHFTPAGEHFASLLIGAESHDVAFERTGEGYLVHLAAGCLAVAVADAGLGAPAGTAAVSGPARVCAPMPGRVVRVLAEVGRRVETGDGLVVVEAMKMENELKAPRGGRVESIEVGEGQAVEAGALLLVVGE